MREWRDWSAGSIAATTATAALSRLASFASPLVVWASVVGLPSDAREGTQRHALPKRPGGPP